MDSFENSYTNKIPYDDTPIFRKNSIDKQSKSLKTKIFSVIFVLMFIMNIALMITCAIYLQNGKIKQVNIYNDKYSTQTVTHLVDSMRSAKAHSVCVAAGLGANGINILQGDKLTNSQFYSYTKSHGAGFLYKIVGDSAYFVTCYHVINYQEDESLANNNRIWVLPASMLVPLEVELVGYSKTDDVAVLKYTHSNILETLEGCTPVDVYDSTFLSEYEDVFTIGNPLNYGLTGTNGKITAFRQIVTMSGVKYSWIKTNAAINPGNSGGALYNANGQFIGMVNANIPETSTGDPVSNIAFAIPGRLVSSIADNIIENNIGLTKPVMVNLGITFGVDEIMGIERYKDVYQDQDGNYKDVEQQYVIIKSFDNNSLAKSAGLKEGDRIVSVELMLYGNDEPLLVPILNQYSFYEYAYAIVPSSFMKFNIARQNEFNETISMSVSVRATKYS